MTKASPTRTVSGIELPDATEWKVDAGHAEVGFVGRHFMITKVRGRFTNVEASVHIAERPEDSTVEAVIDMTSVHTGDKTRDDHLRSPDFFDVENHPRATFRSTAVSWDATTGTMTGDLTIKEVTHPVTLDVEYLGYAHDPWGNDRAVFSAHGKVNREDWGLTWNLPLDSGGLLVSKEIDLVIEIETIRTA
ncbi:MAG TPA: YceI family protein [Streptosporangiaceae bacterium]|jgi:polyisoprenoid-binding protein YceI